MKFIHLSDLHLGKKVNDYSMIEDQQFILEKIITIIDEEQPDAVIIAGDVYDKSIPPIEAVSLMNDFLVQLNQRHLQTFIISGNHDSAVRLAYGSSLFDLSGIHFSPVYNGIIKPFVLRDAVGEVKIYLLPFIKPAQIRNLFPDETVESYTDAMRIAIKKMDIDPSERNILITHQFITGGERSESEDLSVGGADNIDAAVFDDFDYVALGHLHRAQNIGTESIRYCGSPLKYSFSEAGHSKSVTIVELAGKGTLNIRTVPLQPLHDMVELTGTYAELTLKSFYEATTYQEDYVRITLTDEEDIPDAVSKLRVIYHQLMKLDYDNRRTRHHAEISEVNDIEKKTPLQLFEAFYQQQNGSELSTEQKNYMTDLIESVWEDEE